MLKELNKIGLVVAQSLQVRSKWGLGASLIPWTIIGAIGIGANLEGLVCSYLYLHHMICSRSLGVLLLKHLKLAIEKYLKQDEAFKVYCANQAVHVPERRQAVEDFEKDPSKPNPYELSKSGTLNL